MRLSFIFIGWAAYCIQALAQSEPPNEASGSHNQSDSPFIARAGENLYFTSDNCCGLVAAYMVANDLGQPVALDDLASQLPVSSAGTSMHDLETFLRGRGFDTAAVEIDSGKLYAILEGDPRLRAIALIRPRHWITLFSASQGKFDCYNYPERAVIGQELFDRLFAKRALLVGPSHGSLNYLRDSSFSWTNLLLLSIFATLIVGLLVMTWRIFRRRVRHTTKAFCSADSP